MRVNASQEGAESDAQPLDVDSTPSANSASVYVKNLPFSVGDTALQAHFDEAVSAAGGVIRSALVHKRQVDTKATKSGAKQQKLLSSGFGFVECSSEAVAKAVIKRLQVREAACSA